jgi:HAD superfamily hydrolase (TIGR01509 family)
MLKAIIFDVDGTLAETEELHRIAFNMAFDDNDLPWNWDRAQYRELLKVSGGKERIRHFIDIEELPQRHRGDLPYFIARLHQSKTAVYTQAVIDGKAELRPGVRELIAAAQAEGIRLAIATTTSLPNVEALLQAAFSDAGEGLFEVICAGDSVPAKKPAPDIYLDALRQLGLSAADCIAIEDSRNGLLSAHQAGIPTLVTPGIYTDDQDFSEAQLVLPDLSSVAVTELLAGEFAHESG